MLPGSSLGISMLLPPFPKTLVDETFTSWMLVLEDLRIVGATIGGATTE